MDYYYEQHIRKMQLAGLSERSQKSYTRAVRMLKQFCDKSPELITEAELEAYFLHRKHVAIQTNIIVHAAVVAAYTKVRLTPRLHHSSVCFIMFVCIKWAPNTMKIAYCGIRFFYEISLATIETGKHHPSRK